MLNKHELHKYNQQISLSEVGKEGQLTLKNTKVLCIGAGGLGTPVSLYLVAAGIGSLGIIDGDQVALNNLPRQILYTENDITKDKTIICKNKLLNINPHCDIKTYQNYLTEDNAIDIIQNYDLVVDCSDNYATRYLVNDTCHELDKINVFACIHQFNGLCTVFPGKKGPCYRCLFETMPDDALPNCAEAGILNTMAGIVGTIQAHETIKLILGIKTSLQGTVLLIDGLTMTMQKITLIKNPTCPACSANKGFAELHRPKFSKTTCPTNHENSITFTDFLTFKNSDKTYALIDVRSTGEFKQQNIDSAVNIPLDQLENTALNINKDTFLFVYCQSGKRSAVACDILKKRGYQCVYHIRGGINQIHETL